MSLEVLRKVSVCKGRKVFPALDSQALQLS